MKVKESEDIPVRDLSGYAYSFVLVKIMPLHEYVESEFKTNFVRGGFYPAYGDAFHFSIPKDVYNEQVLYLYQYELNRWSKKDGIGQITFELKKADLLKEKSGELAYKRKLRPYDPLLGLVRKSY